MVRSSRQIQFDAMEWKEGLPEKGCQLDIGYRVYILVNLEVVAGGKSDTVTMSFEFIPPPSPLRKGGKKFQEEDSLSRTAAPPHKPSTVPAKPSKRRNRLLGKKHKFLPQWLRQRSAQPMSEAQPQPTPEGRMVVNSHFMNPMFEGSAPLETLSSTEKLLSAQNESRVQHV